MFHQIIFDTLKRYEYSPLIRGSVIFSLACIVRSKAVGQGCNDVQDTIALISRVCDAAEGHLLCGNGNGNTDGLTFPGDFDFLLVCLQRLINATVLIMMAIDPASNLMFRLFQLWETIRLSSSHVYVERECIEFIVGASMFPTDALSCRAASLYLQKVFHFVVFFARSFTDTHYCRHYCGAQIQMLKFCKLRWQHFVL